jgi:[protein-PII] uridylyltransferase
MAAADVRIPTPSEAEARIRERADAVDQTVKVAFEQAFADRPSGVAALAVGGFGRHELFPFSDVDVMILTADGVRNSEVRENAGRFIQALWDSGLRLSHSVHTVSECCELYEHNVELSISLLDRRFLCGERDVFEQLESEIPQFFRVQSRSIARHLVRLTRVRHSKYQNTIYHLEPNLKECPGGLRDIQVVEWLRRLTPGDREPPLSGARHFLFPLRCFLHLRSARDDNVLTFEAQDAVSAKPAEMMRNYYRHARAVYRRVSDLLESAEERDSSLLRQFRDWRSRVSNTDFSLARDHLYVRSPAQLTAEPGVLSRLFEFSAHHGVPLARETERRVSEAVIETRYAPRWPELRAILEQPKTSVALRAMEDTGALQAMIPEWAGIECLVVRDFYHRFTVDEHTLVAMEGLENLADRRLVDLLGEVDSPALLKLAILLHDIGKGSGNQVGEAARLLPGIFRRLDIPASNAETVRWLVLHHLDLSSVMMTRDLDDAATARLVADSCGTIEILKMLTLLTAVDIAAVNPSAMTPWRMEQLWRTYLIGHQELTRELETERIHNPVVARPEIADFLDGFPTRYLRTHSEAEIGAHFELSLAAEQSGAAVRVERLSGFYRAVVVARDRPFLFASLAGALAAFGVNILKAEAFANSGGMILDTFAFSDPLRNLELNPSELERLQDTLTRVAKGREDVKRLLLTRRKPAPRTRRIQPRIAFNNEVSESATLVEILAEDRPGLLYDLAGAISNSGCNIEVVLIDTESHKALDVFYITANGAKLDAAAEQRVNAALVKACAG